MGLNDRFQSSRIRLWGPTQWSQGRGSVALIPRTSRPAVNEMQHLRYSSHPTGLHYQLDNRVPQIKPCMDSDPVWTLMCCVFLRQRVKLVTLNKSEFCPGQHASGVKSTETPSRRGRKSAHVSLKFEPDQESQNGGCSGWCWASCFVQS